MTDAPTPTPPHIPRITPAGLAVMMGLLVLLTSANVLIWRGVFWLVIDIVPHPGALPMLDDETASAFARYGLLLTQTFLFLALGRWTWKRLD